MTTASTAKPDRRPATRTASGSTTSLMRALAAYIDRHAGDRLSLRELATQAQLSPAHVQRSFKAVLGVSPKAYQDAARLRRFKGGLKAGKPVLEAITDAGFQSTSRVYGHAARQLGMTPSVYRAGGAGELITYVVRETRLGPLAMAATDRGVCFAQFGPSEAALVATLEAEFPRARVLSTDLRHSPELDAWVAAFEAHVAGSAPRPELPLDLRGTAFQIRVWNFLLGVPAGTVISYGELASGIDAPGAVRAAASACAANRVAVLVPCHRVLRGDGGLGGYAWGVERKRRLLEQERAGRSGTPRRG